MKEDLIFKYLNDAQERIELAKMYLKLAIQDQDAAESEKPTKNGPSESATLTDTGMYYSQRIEESLDSLREHLLSI